MVGVKHKFFLTIHTIVLGGKLKFYYSNLFVARTFLEICKKKKRYFEGRVKIFIHVQ